MEKHLYRRWFLIIKLFVFKLKEIENQMFPCK